MTITAKFEPNKNGLTLQISLDDLDVSLEDWNSFDATAKISKIRDYIDNHPEPPYWELVKFEED